MPTDDEIHNDLLAIHSRLGVIEGKVTLVARADRPRILEMLEGTIRQQPLIGQIYLLLDGNSTQRDLHEKLQELGIKSSEMTVSRRLNEMETEHGIADPIFKGPAKMYVKDPEMEKVLNLSKNIRKWLESDNEAVPEDRTVTGRPDVRRNPTPLTDSIVTFTSALASFRRSRLTAERMAE